MAGSNRKKQRTPKKSLGIHGATKHPLGTVEKVLLGKGLIQSFRPAFIKTPWLGVREIERPFDKVQADLNRELYPHLFHDEYPTNKRKK